MLMMSQPAMPPRSDLIEDFSARALGSLAGQGWTARDGTTAMNFTVQADSTSLSGRSVLMDKTTSDAVRRIVFDRAGTVTDAEILTRVKFLATLSLDAVFVSIRVTGASDAVYAYPTGPSSTAAYQNKLSLEKTASGSSALMGTSSFTPVAGTWYWLRLRASSTTFSAKIWAQGASEPAFQISQTAAAPASGVVSMGIFRFDENYTYDYFAVALDGATAPFPQG